MSIKKSMIFVVVCLCIFAAVGCEKESLGNTENRPLFNAESTYFEKFDSKIEGNKCFVNGVANLISDDENAGLIDIRATENIKTVITGSMDYESGEADIYLVTPDNEKKCILSREEIKEQDYKINVEVDLESGDNRFFLKGENSVIGFELEFSSEPSEYVEYNKALE